MGKGDERSELNSPPPHGEEGGTAGWAVAAWNSTPAGIIGGVLGGFGLVFSRLRIR